MHDTVGRPTKGDLVPIIDVTRIGIHPDGRGPVLPDDETIAGVNSSRLDAVLVHEAKHGDTMYFPRGSYYVARPLVLHADKRISILGDGGLVNPSAQQEPYEPLEPISAIIASSDFTSAPPDLSAKSVMNYILTDPLQNETATTTADAAAVVVFRRPQVKTLIPHPKIPGHNAPVFKPTNSYRALVKDIDIYGNRGIKGNKGVCSGLWIDNMGILMENVGVYLCGSHGMVLTWCQDGVFTNCETSENALDGVFGIAGYDSGFEPQTPPLLDDNAVLHPGEPITYDQVDCNGNLFSKFVAEGNGASAIHIASGSGNMFIAPDLEGNQTAIQLGKGAVPGATQNRFIGVWDENNGSSLVFDSNGHGADNGNDGATWNSIEFARTDYTPDDLSIYRDPITPEPNVDQMPYFSNIIQGPVGGVRELAPLYTHLEALAAHTFAIPKQVILPSISIKRSVDEGGRPIEAAGFGAKLLERTLWSGDSGGVIELKTGSGGLSNGVLVEVKFARLRLLSPIILLLPANGAAMQATDSVYVPAPGELIIPEYIDPTPISFKLLAASPLLPETVYVWTWFAVELGNVSQKSEDSVIHIDVEIRP